MWKGVELARGRFQLPAGKFTTSPAPGRAGVPSPQVLTLDEGNGAARESEPITLKLLANLILASIQKNPATQRRSRFARIGGRVRPDVAVGPSDVDGNTDPAGKPTRLRSAEGAP